MQKIAALTLAASVFALAGSSARAERPETGYVPVPISPDTTEHGGGWIIYMNRAGGTFTGTAYGSWNEDSRTNESTIFQGSASIAPYPYGDSSWAAVMTCMREIYAPFNIEVTDVDPGSGVYHIESVVAGGPDDIGMDPQVGGVAPFACGPIQNAITFSFPEVWGNDPRAICETAAQETAHAFGLDHEYYCPDPMTYLFGCGNKSFRDYDAACGEYGSRACQCGGSTQNSYQMLVGILGARPSGPPSVQITYPADGATVQEGFQVNVDAVDDVGIQRVELFLDTTDGGAFATDSEYPYTFTAPVGLGEGSHTVIVRAYNLAEISADHQVGINLEPPCESADSCGDGNVCMGGQCLPGPDQSGGLGSRCQETVECFTGFCDTPNGADYFCTVGCDPAAPACPQGFDCPAIYDDGTGFCVPGDDVPTGGGSAGCCAVVGGSTELPVPWLTLSLCAGLALLLVRRRRSE